MKRLFFIIIASAAIIPMMATDEKPDSIEVRELNEVIVEGEKPQIKGQDGIMVVDLANIVKDKPVSNVLEALGYLPGVVNYNGQIGLSSASSVTIILNGELTTMPLQNLYQLLYSTPVDRLKNVEIMYSAPAKYHVNGAVINVVLKTPRPLDGLMGQATLGYNQAHYASYSGGLNATYAVKDWTFDLNWSLSRNESYNRQETYSNHLLEGTRHMINDDMRQISRSWTNMVYAATSYKTLKLSYNGQITSDIRNRSLSDGTFGNYSNLYKGLEPTSYHNIALRYKAPFGLTIGGDYTYFSENRCQNLFKGSVEQIKAENRQSINRWAQAEKSVHEILEELLNLWHENLRSILDVPSGRIR